MPIPAPTVGVGSLIVENLLEDVSYQLFEPVVNTTVPAPGFAAGAQTVLVWDASLYVGAYVIVGVIGGDAEVVLVTATNPGTSFTATFLNAHVAGDPVIGATFPTQSVAGDPFFTQAEMLGYVSEAVNDFLLRVPLVYAVTTSISMPPTSQFTTLPTDCMKPVRVATFGYPLRETSQSYLDSTYYPWAEQALSQPRVYYRDHLPIQNVGVWPRAGNNIPLEVVYAARGAQTLGWGDGFPMPDPFSIYVLYRALSFFYSKDGEIRQPGLAKYFQSRFEFGVKVTNMILNLINDSNAQQ